MDSFVSENTLHGVHTVSPSEKEHIRSRLLEAGAVAVGFAKAGEVSSDTLASFNSWIAKGNHAGMAYMENHYGLRKDPRRLLDGTKTVISLAFSFAQPRLRNPDDGYIAQYAYGADYHKVLRKVLRPVIKTLFEDSYGSSCRICIDSAPVMERYWAQKAGIGYVGDNGAIIVPGAGSLVFLVEILTTLSIPPDRPLMKSCLHCGACRKACPGGAINSDGTIDSRRCLSYLTIEHKGPFPPDITNNQKLKTKNQKPKTKNLFGCDRCLTVCPLNASPRYASLPSLLPSDEFLTLSSADIEKMSQEEFDRGLPASPLRRAGLDGLKRNLGVTSG